MVRSKTPSKKQQKQQKRGIDFKKIKRKLGRKLPPPNNATNTEIKSKAIILPEQSVAADKAGLAVSKKGLTLKELLQQTSHYSAKVRKDALIGVKDLFQKHPEELRLHKYAVIQKLRERITDDDKTVREMLYQLFKTVIFPAYKEDMQGPFISLMMTSILNAMTDLALDVRLMGFKFVELLVQCHPASFSLYAEKILQNYEDILRTNQLYLQDKGKLKSPLAGLFRCLSILSCDRRNSTYSAENTACEALLHAFEPDFPKESAGSSLISGKLKGLVPVLVNCFQDFIPSGHNMARLDAQSFDCMHCILQSIDLAVGCFAHRVHQAKTTLQPSCQSSDVELWDQTLSVVLLKKLFSVFPLNSMHHLSEKVDDRYFVLNIVITEIFLHYSEWIYPPAGLLEKFLEFIESALLGKICSDTRSGKRVWEKNILLLLPFIPKLVPQVEIYWKSRLLQAFTITFGDCDPASSLKLACLSAIEEMLVPEGDVVFTDASDPLFEYYISWIRALPLLLIQLGDKHPYSSQIVLLLLLRLGQYANLNPSFAWDENMQSSFYKFYNTCGEEGDSCPFIRLPRDSQELSVCCLYYFSNLDSLLLRSIASCCLCPDLESFVLFRIIEVLHSAFVAGHVQVADHISFFVTLLARFHVFPENIYPGAEGDVKVSNRGTFKSVIRVVCSCLSQMGDDSIIFRMLEKLILDQLLLKPPHDNACALLRMLVMLDSKPTRLSEQSIITLSNYLPGYIIDVILYLPEDDDETSFSSRIQTRHYYILPCFFLFDRSHKLLQLCLKMMGSLIKESYSSPSSHTESSSVMNDSKKITAVVSALLLMHKDAKVQKIISLFKAEMNHILEISLSSQSTEKAKMTIEEKHKLQCACNRLKKVTNLLPDQVPAN